MKDNIIELFPKKVDVNLLSNTSEPFDYQAYIDNVRKIQAGFDTLNAYDKGVAFDTVSDTFVAILQFIFETDFTKEKK